MYLLRQFGSVALPAGAPRHTAGTANSQQQIINVVGGGVFDVLGSEQAAPALPFDLRYECKAFDRSSAAALRSTLDELRGCRGAQAKLWREGLDDGTRQWATARLVEVGYDTEARHSHGLFQPLVMVFTVQSLWRGVQHGAPWSVNAGQMLNGGLYLNMGDRHVLTTSPKTITLRNDGTARTDDVVFTLEAGAVPVTGLILACGDCELLWSGTVAVGTSLVIDCSPLRRSVRNNGVAAYGSLHLGAGHKSEAWMRLARGANSLVVTRTGGSAATYLTVGWYDAWE